MLHKLSSIGKNEEGFTLIEILISIIITATIVSSIAMAISQVFTINAASSNRMEAIKQVENAMHYINRDGESAWMGLIPNTEKISSPNKLPFATTTLSSDCPVGATTVSVASTGGFPASGQIIVGIGQYTELVSYTNKGVASFSGVTHRDSQGNPVAGTEYAHIANNPVSTLALHWDDAVYNETFSTYEEWYYDVIYGLTSTNVLQRTEFVTKPDSTIQQTILVADHIDPSLDNSFFTFDGSIFTVQLKAAIPGFKPADETRTLQVKPRTIR